MVEPVRGVCALVLAAGQGSRYREHADQDKLLAPCNRTPDAPPVLAATLGALCGVAERLVVVTRDDNSELLAWLGQQADRYGAEVLAVHTQGLGHSLAQAVRQFPSDKGWLVALGDMPYVRPATFRRIAEQIEPPRLVVASHQGQRGHPRGIGRDHALQVMSLDGERGAQALFSGGAAWEVEVDDSGVLQDIDRPDDRRNS